MKFVNPSFEVMHITSDALEHVEKAGRTCYKSEEKITERSKRDFIRMIIRKGHESVLEHASMTVRIVCDRGVSHELVRHRIASFSQESTRYCNYSKDKFDNELTFIRPCFWLDCPENERHTANHALLEQHCLDSERRYNQMINQGATPQEARYILPNGLKTEIVVTANFREWREIFRQRCSPGAHPQMREIMIPLKNKMKEVFPDLFFDFE